MIKLNKVCFSYDGEHPVLVDFCMEIPDGGAIAVMGASGSGKTTLLRILLGLEKPNSGEILGLNNKRFAVVFQEDRLLQHRTARQNVEIPLIGTQIEKTNVHKIAGTALRDVELNGFESFFRKRTFRRNVPQGCACARNRICKKRIGQRCRNSR